MRRGVCVLLRAGRVFGVRLSEICARGLGKRKGGTAGKRRVVAGRFRGRAGTRAGGDPAPFPCACVCQGACAVERGRRFTPVGKLCMTLQRTGVISTNQSDVMHVITITSQSGAAVGRVQDAKKRRMRQTPRNRGCAMPGCVVTWWAGVRAPRAEDVRVPRWERAHTARGELLRTGSYNPDID